MCGRSSFSDKTPFDILDHIDMLVRNSSKLNNISFLSLKKRSAVIIYGYYTNVHWMNQYYKRNLTLIRTTDIFFRNKSYSLRFAYL